MTSGTFKSFPINKIWVDREKRQRRDLGDLTELKTSISKAGLIHPPVIKRDGELIVGERRWNSCKQLGWTNIPVQFQDELDPVQLQLVEFEENVRRLDISWQDETLTIKNYHDLRKETEEDWSQEKTAEALGLSSTNVSSRLQVAEALRAGNERVLTAPQYSTARGIVERDQARRAASVRANINFDNARPLEQIIADAEAEPRPVVPLLHRDFHEWATEYEGPKFNFIHCDFPYGVGMHNSDQGSGDGHGTYKDTPDVYWELLTTLITNQDRLVADSAHIMFWFSMDFYHETLSKLTLAGWKIDPFPLVWIKSDNTGILPDARRGPRRIYETAFFGYRGDRFVVQAVSNAMAVPGREKTLHMNEKPIAMLRHFFRMFVDKYSIVLDPTAGSANALKAAQALNAEFVLGLEQNKEFFDRSVEGYYNEEL